MVEMCSSLYYTLGVEASIRTYLEGHWFEGFGLPQHGDHRTTVRVTEEQGQVSK